MSLEVGMQASNVIIIHGAYGFPEENWFGWLKRELCSINIHCDVPEMPTPDGQYLSVWFKKFEECCGNRISTNTILIGHSLGAAFVLRLLESFDFQIRAAMLAGAFVGKVGVEKFDSINASFFETPFNWNFIKERAQTFYCYHGDNDKYVTRDNFDNISDNLNAKKIIISNGGHLNSSAGYDKFP